MNPALKLSLSAIILIIAGCSSHQQTDQQLLSSQATLAVNWMQQSGEYQALSWQAFNVAKVAFLNNEVPKGYKKAVIVDIDETVLDNSPYAAWQINNSHSYSDKDWAKWVDARQSKALPGSVSFALFVKEHGGRIFYISNRSQQNFDSTVSNLKTQGFPDISAQNLLLKDETGSNKIGRFNRVKEMGYFPVLYVGDNLDDFTAESYNKNNVVRRDFVTRNSQEFGKKFIVLPNPAYGGWESGMGNNYLQSSAVEKMKIRHSSLSAWTPVSSS